MALTATEWNAIGWYMKHRKYTMRDMMAGPMVRFRDKDDEIVEVNISDIKLKYAGRNKRMKAKQNKGA